MATAVTQEMQESDDRRYVTDSHVYLTCEIKLIFYASLRSVMFIFPSVVTSSVEGSRWCEGKCSWRPTSESILEAAEAKILQCEFSSRESCFPYPITVPVSKWHAACPPPVFLSDHRFLWLDFFQSVVTMLLSVD